MIYKFVRCFVLVVFLVLITRQLFSQTDRYFPSSVTLPSYYHKTSRLDQMKAIIPGSDSTGFGKTIENIENTPWTNNNPNQKNLSFSPYLQNKQGNDESGKIIENFMGISNLQYKIPPDTQGDVGTEYYLQMINMSFAVFDKEGNTVYGPASNLSIWQEAPAPWSNNSNGDPITLYDEVAHRWLISELSFPNHPYGPYYMKIAISETEDPTGSWYLYGYEYEYFCDYPKLSVWHDGYYLTNNNNYWDGLQWHFHAVGVSVFERDSMLIGSPEARRIFFDFYPNTQPWSVLPADFDGIPPENDTPGYLAYYKEGSPDKIYIYKVLSDWQNILNSSMQWMTTLFPEPFNGSIPNGISQPENAPYLSSMSNRLLYRLQYRNFANYECMVTNHTINRGDGIAAIRWYEFRKYSNNWEIFQQGTYSPDDHHRWMGSIAMDGYGNIALGYSVSSISVYPSIRYTAHTFDGPLGIMNVAEKVIIEGSGVQTNPYHRWGDYSCMSVDPTDQTTFWYTQQYYEITGDRCWETRIASFNINDFLSLDLSSNYEIICEGDSVQLYANPNGGSEIYSFLWSSYPPLLETSNQNPIVTPKINTTFYCEVNDGVNSVSNQILIQVLPSPEVYAGEDTTILSGEPYYLNEATASDYMMIEWTTNGTGYFDDKEALNPTYYSGTGEIGIVEITMTAFGYFPCTNISSTLNLEILPHDFDLDIKVYLDGPYNGSSMGNDIYNTMPLAQPYGDAPWNYNGSEFLDSIPNSDVIDWILVELRDAVDPSLATNETMIARQAAILMNDGHIRNLDGSGYQQFSNLTIQYSLFVVIWHRNHLAIMSANPLVESGGVYTYDFTIANNQAYGTDAQKDFGNGVYGMLSADANADGLVNIDDYILWGNQSGNQGYKSGDFDMNEQVNNLDKNEKWGPNSGKGSQVPQ